MHDHARGPKTWLIDSDLLYAGMFQDSTKDSRRIPYVNESIIISNYSRDSTRIVIPMSTYFNTQQIGVAFVMCRKNMMLEYYNTTQQREQMTNASTSYQ